MKQDTRPLIVAVFLVVGTLLSGAFIFNNRADIVEMAMAHQKAEFFVSVARGAENATALFGARIVSPVTAVSADSVMGKRDVFSVALGAVKDPGFSSGLR